MAVSKTADEGSTPSRPARILRRRCPADIFEHFEFIEKGADGDGWREIVGVKCRLCGEVIIDEMTARSLLSAGARYGKNPVMDALALLTVPLLLWGGMHMLFCRRTKMN